jgi:drug/metabolite transporter (DMT)-like permease
VKPTFILNFAALLCFTALGQFSFKLAADRLGIVSPDVAWFRMFFHEPSVALILFANLGALFSYLKMIKSSAVGPVFAAAHLSIVVVIVVSVAFLHETLNWVQALGCVAIMAGVAILAFTESSTTEPGPAR